MRDTIGSATNTLNEFNSADKYGDAYGLDSAAMAEGIKSRLKKPEKTAQSEKKALFNDDSESAQVLLNTESEKQNIDLENDKENDRQLDYVDSMLQTNEDDDKQLNNIMITQSINKNETSNKIIKNGDQKDSNYKLEVPIEELRTQKRRYANRRPKIFSRVRKEAWQKNPYNLTNNNGEIGFTSDSSFENAYIKYISSNNEHEYEEWFNNINNLIIVKKNTCKALKKRIEEKYGIYGLFKNNNKNNKKEDNDRIENDIDSAFDEDSIIELKDPITGKIDKRFKPQVKHKVIDKNGNESEEEIWANQKQLEVIQSVNPKDLEDPKKNGLKAHDFHQKGNYGEILVDVDLEKTGKYKRVSNDRLIGLNAPTTHGIDGIYKCANTPPDYLIVEVKNSKQLKLGTTKNYGNELSDDWIANGIFKSLSKSSSVCNKLYDSIKKEEYLYDIHKDIKDSDTNNQTLNNSRLQFCRIIAHVQENNVKYYRVNNKGEIMKSEDGKYIEYTA